MEQIINVNCITTETEGKFEFPKSPVVEVVQTLIVQKTVTKADLARVVFNKAYRDPLNVPKRELIIKMMMEEAGLTKAGAATYLQNFKKKAGLVVDKKAA